VIDRLNQTLKSSEIKEISSEIQSQLENEVMFLGSLHSSLFQPMLEDVKNSVDTLRELNKKKKELVSKIEDVADAADKAQRSLKEAGSGQKVRVKISCVISSVRGF